MALIEIRTEPFGDAMRNFRPPLYEMIHTMKRKREIVIAPDMIGQITIPIFPKTEKIPHPFSGHM